MTAPSIARLAEARVFQPRSQFGQLASDHVAFDELNARPVFETAALRAATERRTSVAIRGPVGAGKSSLIAALCSRLQTTHIALRVPVVGADDPTSVAVLAAVTLSAALSALAFERVDRATLERARADRVARERRPVQFGAKLGGGAVPAEVHAEVRTLTEQLETDQLARDRLAGLDRLVAILVARGIEPIFVLEDTEAASGGRREDERIEAFFAGPVTAFVREVDAPCVIAVQDVLASARSFRRLEPSLELIDLPTFADPHRALKAIARHRLEAQGFDVPVADVIADDALDALVAFYDEAKGSLRLTLAALQSSLDHAADIAATNVRAAHVRLGAQEWRAHVDLS